ncbi:neutral zinc metallopeptidase [Elizabethkingia meningoseptica]|uniref:KPN_02809 family neutral zinc metallopeptidase n=1 Tax=Elizabethkingia meningoseptica TaxID=238 RepID=UPI0022F1CB1E|nr:neutral zinc metallopeptidase [Elizabethkingia meningoseptica]EJK5330286.1 neutral zinc metallopeptidase [Elizabethkingia meningoseptica]MDE5432678.1 neutral zinc metallopeptidase [Elizabethkingia meningoseptica]MDE5469748.1 neutral zinc metallopeptidase [Elizabethkingia meningoseptica]MDE5476666.1 neutral zinc metallopeptidase [Elizabethkingia meningoseptica]MDE5479921.1 neutral zinc metallopeptidase [Elizabethkingia meningoseptica]
MKWTDERGGNVEDRRGMSGGGMMVGGGLGTLIIAAIVFFLGGDPSAILNSGGSSAPVQTEQRQPNEQDKQLYELVSMLDAWNTKTWTQIFNENGMKYVAPKIVMFSDQTSSGCGPAQAAMGPFYCPADQKVYVDMSFFNELQSRYGAKVSEFTVAYVLGHEIGHHVQTLLGTTQKVDQMRRSGHYSEADMNRVSVAVELQADFYAGLWARKNNERVQGGILEPGDIEAAVSAAQAVGDDNIQKRATGYVNQESFTHGSSAQRVEWFMKGYNTGDIKQGDTFNALLR